MNLDSDKNYIVLGDCKDWLPSIPSDSIDMCYIDPPFFTQRDFGDFNDKWKGEIPEYIEWMRVRVQGIHRVLKRTGSIFLHCDYRANYRIRDILNEVFGEKNFVNEIFWQLNSDTQRRKGLRNNINTIFYYAKNFKFNKYKPAYRYRTKNEIKKCFSNPDNDPRGPYHSESLNARGIQIYDGRKEFIFKGILAHWRISKEKLQKLYEDGRLKKGKYFRKKIYLNETGGKKLLGNLWTHFIQLKKKERTNYSTQKPVALLKQIIEMTTDKNDIVLDCFSGSGTTAVAAHELGRKFIVGDINEEAISVTKQRLKGVDFELFDGSHKC